MWNPEMMYFYQISIRIYNDDSAFHFGHNKKCITDSIVDSIPLLQTWSILYYPLMSYEHHVNVI